MTAFEFLFSSQSGFIKGREEIPDDFREQALEQVELGGDGPGCSVLRRRLPLSPCRTS